LIAHVYGGVPPLAASEAEYAVWAVAGAKFFVAIARIAGETKRVTAAVAD
jgi:hypothetical protein